MLNIFLKYRMRQFLVLISVFVLAADSNACGQATAVFPGEKSVGINIPGTKTTVFDDDGFLTIALAAKECISRFNYPQIPVFTSRQVKCAEENKSAELLRRTPPQIGGTPISKPTRSTMNWQSFRNAKLMCWPHGNELTMIEINRFLSVKMARA
jgi:hypothetical protein